MPSKMVNDRSKEAELVLAAGDTHAEAVAAALSDSLAPLLEPGEAAPDTRLLIKLTGRLLARAADKMAAADQAHTAELGDDDAPRQARDEAAGALYTKLSELRAFLAGTFGEDSMSRLGFTRQVPRDPALLSKFAGEVLGALSKKPLPSPKKKGVSYDPAADEDVAAIAAVRERLDAALADVTREVREAEATLVQKNQAIETYDEVFSRVVTFLSGLFRFAGQEELADRLRPYLRQSRRTDATPPTPTPGVPTLPDPPKPSK